MDQRSPIEGRYRFGPFLLDPGERLLTREAAPVALTTRLFELLLAFVRSPGVLLTKSDLMDAVWPDRVVDEGSLTQAIFSLRKALGENDEDGRYITTVTGRGYSFSAPVENVGAAPRTDASREALSPAPAVMSETTPIAVLSGKRNPMPLYLLAGALAVVIAGAAFLLLARAAPAAGKPLVVVVSDFQNLSNNPLFDRTFTTAAKSDLQQSPHPVRPVGRYRRGHARSDDPLEGRAAHAPTGAGGLRAQQWAGGDQRQHRAGRRRLSPDSDRDRLRQQPGDLDGQGRSGLARCAAAGAGPAGRRRAADGWANPRTRSKNSTCPFSSSAPLRSKR
jgi:DNA-binding winged helix-turn-helix (wHTH) protein